MSRFRRFFITTDQIHGSQIVIYGEDVRHIATVLRMKRGDSLVLCDGYGLEYEVKIIQVDREEIMTEIISKAQREPIGPNVMLGLGLPKADKMELIIQKATELGVASIVPLVTERTIVKLRDEQKRIARWQRICREAAMQSNRCSIPQIESILSLRDFLATNKPLELALLAWEEGTQPIKAVLQKHRQAKKIIAIIGPEGGFSLAEAEMARTNGYNLVRLGANILRTETAALTVLSMIIYEYS